MNYFHATEWSDFPDNWDDFEYDPDNEPYDTIAEQKGYDR